MLFFNFCVLILFCKACKITYEIEYGLKEINLIGDSFDDADFADDFSFDNDFLRDEEFKGNG